LGVCIFSFFAARPTSADELIRLAEQFQLQSVEINSGLLASEPQRVRKLLERNNMSCVVASGQLLRVDVESLLKLAHQLNARAVRVILSGVLEGDRRKVDGGDWQAYLHFYIAVLSGTPLVGICLDIGNLLAVLQDSVEFVQIVAPFVRDVHLKDYRKDYRLLRAPQGFYLQRCILGKGIVEFEVVLRTLLNQAPQDLTLHTELGALQRRHIRWRDPSW